jgi:hypothetical protein
MISGVGHQQGSRYAGEPGDEHAQLRRLLEVCRSLFGEHAAS